MPTPSAQYTKITMPACYLRRFHLDVHLLAHVLQQVAALKVLIRMDNRFQLVGGQYALLFGLFDLRLVQVLEYSVNNVSLLAF